MRFNSFILDNKCIRSDNIIQILTRTEVLCKKDHEK